MVRRSAALNLGKFAATVEAMYLKSDIMTFFRDLTQDGTCAFHRGPFIFCRILGAGLELNAKEWCKVRIRISQHNLDSLNSFVEGSMDATRRFHFVRCLRRDEIRFVTKSTSCETTGRSFALFVE